MGISAVQLAYWCDRPDCQADLEQSRRVRGRPRSCDFSLHSHIKRFRKVEQRQWPNINSEHYYSPKNICLPRLPEAKRSCSNKIKQVHHYNCTSWQLQDPPKISTSLNVFRSCSTNLVEGNSHPDTHRLVPLQSFRSRPALELDTQGTRGSCNQQ